MENTLFLLENQQLEMHRLFSMETTSQFKDGKYIISSVTAGKYNILLGKLHFSPKLENKLFQSSAGKYHSIKNSI